MKVENTKLQKPPRKRMPIWLLALTDIAVAALCLGILLFYQIVLPQELYSTKTIVAETGKSNEVMFQLPDGNNKSSTDNAPATITESAMSSDTDKSIIAKQVQNNFVTPGVNPCDINKKKINGKDGAREENNNIKGKENDNSDNVNKPKGKTKHIDKGKSLSKGESSNKGKSSEAKVVTSPNNKKKTNNEKNNSAKSNKNINKKNVDKNSIPTDKITGSANDDTIVSDKDAKLHVSGNYTNYGNTNTDHIKSDKSESSAITKNDKVITNVNSYSSKHIEFTTNKVEIGTGNDKITYYITDIYVTNVKYIKTAFAKGTYGKNIEEYATDMATDNNALLAISGDYYGLSETSFLIRNGVLYRKTNNDADVCVLFTDGTMKTYSPEKFDAEKILKQGAWQAWTFGPALLNIKGKMLDSFNTTDYLYGQQPRSTIGYVKPGHYVFVVVDGRSPGYSRGVTLNELAQIMIDAGCVCAYNLDGGKSACMVYKDEFVNQPAQGGREISDIIYLGE